MIKQVVFVCAFMVVAVQALAQDSANFVVAIVAPDGRTLNIDVDGILRVSVENGKSSHQIAFQLDDTKAKKFLALTTEIIGKPLVVYICGEEVLRATVRTPIAGGHLVLTGLTKERANELDDILAGRRLCS